MRRVLKFFSLLSVAIVLLIATAVIARFAIDETLEPTPNIAQDLPRNISDASMEFDRRVAERYLVPLNEDELISLLVEDGFEVMPERFHASFQRESIVCSPVWAISWVSDGGVVTDIRGQYRSICL